MVNISNVNIYGLEESVKASKYPMSIDTEKLNNDITNTVNNLATAKIGSGHDNFLNGIIVQFDIKATNKFWVEMQRYHFVDFVSSQSTMHRITKFDFKDSCCEYVDPQIIDILTSKIEEYKKLEAEFTDFDTRLKEIKKVSADDYKEEIKALDEELEKMREYLKNLYLQILYSNPAGFMLTARLTTNYRQLKTIYQQRKGHRLPEWREFCKWVETLPYSGWITDAKN